MHWNVFDVFDFDFGCLSCCRSRIWRTVSLPLVLKNETSSYRPIWISWYLYVFILYLWFLLQIHFMFADLKCWLCNISDFSVLGKRLMAYPSMWVFMCHRRMHFPCFKNLKHICIDSSCISLRMWDSIAVGWGCELRGTERGLGKWRMREYTSRLLKRSLREEIWRREKMCAAC